MASVTQRIVLATAIAGTLDILAAITLTLAYGRAPAAMLRYVASGPFPAATGWGAAGSALGLAVHYALMAAMATVYVLAADRVPKLKASALLWGAVYGVATYVVMNLIVVPLRFDTGFPPSAIGFATQMFCHVFLVGVPIALIAKR